MSWAGYDVNADGIADGEGLEWDATAQAFVPATLGGGSDVAVEDDGTQVTAAATVLDFGTGLTVVDNGSGDVTIDATAAGAGPAGPWFQNNVAANQTDVALTLLDGTRETFPAPVAGTITAIAVLSNEARSAGTLTVTLTLNGTGQSLTATLDGTNTECDTGTGSIAVAACDEIGVDVTTDGSWAPTTADITVTIQFDSTGAGGSGTVPAWMSHLAADGTEDEGQEFTDTLGGTLVEPTGNSTWTQSRGLLSARFDSQSGSDITARMYALSGTWQVGSYIEANLRIMGKPENTSLPTVVAIVAANDGGDALTATDSIVVGTIQVEALVRAITRRGTFTAASAAATSSAEILNAAGPIYVRLTMNASGEWGSTYSPDGVSWTALGIADLTGGITDVTHYGLGVSRWGGGSEESVATCEYLRVYL